MQKSLSLVIGNTRKGVFSKLVGMKFWFITASLLMLFTIPNYVSAQDQFFVSKGVKIRYVTEGTGEAVVLIHGWMGDSSMWGADPSGNTKLNSGGIKGFQFIALDCRGHGKSDKPKDPKKYGAEMAADVLRLLDHLKIKKAHLVGYSSGAFIAGKVVATHPERVLSVVYAGQAPVITEIMKPNDFAEIELFSKAVDENNLGAYIMAVSPSDKPKPTEEQAKAVANYLYGNKDVKAFAAAGRSFKELRVTTKQLNKYKCPILFIYGGDESQHVKGRVANVRSILNRGEVHIVEGGNHITTLAKPDFGVTLINFLNSTKIK